MTIVLNGKTFEVRWDAKRRQVVLTVSVFGLCMADEGATPAQARQLARMLDQAADAGEGGAL